MNETNLNATVGNVVHRHECWFADIQSLPSLLQMIFESVVSLGLSHIRVPDTSTFHCVLKETNTYMNSIKMIQCCLIHTKITFFTI